MVVYVGALWRLARLVETGPRKLFFSFRSSLPAALGSIKNGQTNLLLAGALTHAAIDWSRGRRLPTAAWLILAAIAKPIPIVMILLLAAVDLALAPWLLGGLLLTAALLLLFDSWPYVVSQYQEWFADISSIASSPENRFDDLNGLFRALHVEVPTPWMMLARAVAALLTLAAWWIASRRLPEPRRGLTLLGLSAAYLMLFNPRTESNSYVILATAIAGFAALVLVLEGRRAGWLLVGLEIAMGNGSFGRTVWVMTRLWLMPVLATIFLGFLTSSEIPALSAAPGGGHRSYIRSDIRALSSSRLSDLDLLAGGRRNALVGRQDAPEVQRVRRGNGDGRRIFGRRAAFPHGAEERHGLGKGVLLPIEAGHETAAADLAARFEGPARSGDLAPGERLLLAREGLAEDDSVLRRS